MKRFLIPALLVLVCCLSSCRSVPAKHDNVLRDKEGTVEVEGEVTSLKAKSNILKDKKGTIELEGKIANRQTPATGIRNNEIEVQHE